MNKRILHAALSVFMFFCYTATLYAQGGKATTPTTPAAPSSGFRAEFLKELNTVEQHYMSLAEAIPAEKYAWRPGEGVRSVGEVFMHTAAANYNLPRLVGTPPPAEFKPQGFEKSKTAKAEVVETLKQSFVHLRQATLNVADTDAEKTLDWFGGKNTYRGIFLFMTRHLGEHLGQSVAYARLNGVAPPWTEEQQQRQRQQQPAKSSR